MKGFLKFAVIITVILFAVTSAFALQKPYNFSSGTKIKSAEVNKNFDDLYDNVYVVKSNGAYIGTLVSVDSSYYNVTVMSLQEYTFNLDLNNSPGIIPNLITVGYYYYSGSGCSGTIYAGFNVMNGAVINIGGSLYYVNKTAVKSSISYSSYRYSGSCTSSPGSANAWLLNPNDPAVTGVSSPSFATPITIERR